MNWLMGRDFWISLMLWRWSFENLHGVNVSGIKNQPIISYRLIFVKDYLFKNKNKNKIIKAIKITLHS